MTKESLMKKTKQKTLKAKPETDPLQKEMLDRFIALESVMSPFWSLRCGNRATK